MNLNSLNDIKEILNKAENLISDDIRKLPKEEQAKINELKAWSKNATLEELRDKEINLNKQQKDAFGN